MRDRGLSRRRFGQVVGGFFAALGIGSGAAGASLRASCDLVDRGVLSREEALGGSGWRELPDTVPSELRALVDCHRGVAEVETRVGWVGKDFGQARGPTLEARLLAWDGNLIARYRLAAGSTRWKLIEQAPKAPPERP